MGRGAAQDCGVSVVQPLNAMIAIVRFDMRPHPATQIAAAVSVNFYLAFAHSLDLIVTQTVGATQSWLAPAVFRRLARRVNRPALLALVLRATLTISALPACFELTALASRLKPGT